MVRRAYRQSDFRRKVRTTVNGKVTVQPGGPARANRLSKGLSYFPFLSLISGGRNARKSLL
jgi:hypothetical protein